MLVLIGAGHSYVLLMSHLYSCPPPVPLHIQGYNITNKRVLNWLPLPWFVSWVQLVFGVVYCVTLWAIKLRKRPIVPQEGVKALSVVALCHTIGHVSTVCSLGAVAVSYVLATSSIPLHVFYRESGFCSLALRVECACSYGAPRHFRFLWSSACDAH